MALLDRAKLSPSGVLPGALNQAQEFVTGIKITDGSEAVGRVLTSDADGVGAWADSAALGIPISLTAYDPEPARASVTNLHGGFESLVTGDTLNSGSDITFTQGLGKLVIIINAGSDVAGQLTVTGTQVDRETGVETPAFDNVLAIAGVTTDNSTTDANGNPVHGFDNAYITSVWFTGAITISTTDLTLTDVDIFHCSFEQFNDISAYEVQTLDVNLFVTAATAEFDCYLYSIVVSGNTCIISNDANLHIGTVANTPVANRYYRLRRGNIDKTMDGSSDGVWVEVFYSNTPANIEDVTFKVWAVLL